MQGFVCLIYFSLTLLMNKYTFWSLVPLSDWHADAQQKQWYTAAFEGNTEELKVSKKPALTSLCWVVECFHAKTIYKKRNVLLGSLRHFLKHFSPSKRNCWPLELNHEHWLSITMKLLSRKGVIWAIILHTRKVSMPLICIWTQSRTLSMETDNLLKCYYHWFGKKGKKREFGHTSKQRKFKIQLTAITWF